MKTHLNSLLQSHLCFTIATIHVKNRKPTFVTSEFCQAGLMISYCSAHVYDVALKETKSRVHVIIRQLKQQASCIFTDRYQLFIYIYKKLKYQIEIGRILIDIISVL